MKLWMTSPRITTPTYAAMGRMTAGPIRAVITKSSAATP